MATLPRTMKIEPKTRWAIWGLFLTLWTIALLYPFTGSSIGADEWTVDFRFLFNKSLHLLAYGIIAVLSGWLYSPLRFRWLLMFAIMAHASLSELFQVVVANRTGHLLDVLFDHAGVALGLMVSWNMWASKREEVVLASPKMNGNEVEKREPLSKPQSESVSSMG